MYQIIDIQTKGIMGTYQTLRRAHARADKLDLIYGSVRYIVQRVKVLETKTV